MRAHLTQLGTDYWTLTFALLALLPGASSYSLIIVYQGKLYELSHPVLLLDFYCHCANQSKTCNHPCTVQKCLAILKEMLISNNMDELPGKMG